MKTLEYEDFILKKTQFGALHGFSPSFMPDMLFDFQRSLVEWSVMKGRAAIWADCGLGKSIMQVSFGQNVVEKTNRPILILTPLAVAFQTVKEAEKIGVKAVHRRDGIKAGDKVVVTNYERLHHFDRNDFAAVICDESSILKNFDGKRKAAVTEFMRKTPYRLLCTATAAPNDYIEIGTSSEAIGELGFTDMVGKFFKKVEKTLSRKDEHRGGVYRFRGHSERDFWRWVCSWARAVRKPSDLGFDDGIMTLPPLNVIEHVVQAKTNGEGMLFSLPAKDLREQRDELKRTILERCEKAAELLNAHDNPGVAWCHLIEEGKTLKKMIRGAVEVSGSDSDERKEEVFEAFANGQIRVLVTKAKIAGMGLNWQHCAHQTIFPSHSYEQYYQSIRRSWRFGQTKAVTIDVISSEGQAGVLANLNRKNVAAEKMFANLVALMSNELRLERNEYKEQTNQEIPSWLN